jgi:hypothetical protein
VGLWWFLGLKQARDKIWAKPSNIGLKQPEGLERSDSDLECFADYLENINFLQNMGIFRAEENSV